MMTYGDTDHNRNPEIILILNIGAKLYKAVIEMTGTIKWWIFMTKGQ